MANRMYTKELKANFRLFSSRAFLPLFCQALQAEGALSISKPKVKIFDLNRKGAEKKHLWASVSNVIFSRSSTDIARSYLAALAKEMRKKLQCVSHKYSIPIKDIIKDYLHLCNERIQLVQREKVMEKYTSGSPDLKSLLLSNALPAISRNRKITMRVKSVLDTAETGGGAAGGDEEEGKSFFQASLFFYDAKKKDKEKKQALRRP